MKKFDILVIGNGILGTSVAYALINEDPSLKIAVIGHRERRGSATIAAGAMLNCFGEISKFTFHSKASLEKFNIAREATKQWPEWLDKINSQLTSQDKITITPGTYLLLNNKAGHRESENFSAIYKALKLYQEPFEEVDASLIPGISPSADARALRALYLPNEGALNPLLLLTAIEKACVHLGITFLDTLATEILLDKNKIVGIKTEDGGILQTPVTVLAAGSYTQKLIDQIPSLTKRIPKILAGVGCSLLLKADNHQLKSVVRTPNRSGSCGIHLIPYNKSTDFLYMGASNNIRLFPKAHPKGRDVYYLLERAMEQFNQSLHKAEIISWQIGNRPTTFDTFPLIGSTSIQGLWLLTGTYRDGIHDSPVLATSIAKEILGSKSLVTHLFQPERFPIEVMSKEHALEEFADQYVSVGYEHNMKLPKIAWDSMIKEMAYKRMENLYQQLEIDLGLSPDLLFMFDQEPEMIPLFKEYYRSVTQEFSNHFYLKEAAQHVS